MTEPEANPYAPPLADVKPAPESLTFSSGSYIPGGRKVPTWNGVRWFGRAWKIFAPQWSRWLLLSILFMVMTAVPNLFAQAFISGRPGLGQFVASFGQLFIHQLLLGGAMLACEDQTRSNKLTVGLLFAGVLRKTGPLLGYGLMLFGLSVLLIVAFALVSFLATKMGMGNPEAILKHPLGIVVCSVTGFIAALLGLLTFLLGPALITLQRQSPFSAMRSSFRGVWRNLGACLTGFFVIIIPVFCLLSVAVGMVGALTATYLTRRHTPDILGSASTPYETMGQYLVYPLMVPIILLMLTSLYTAYRDIFIEA